MSQPIDDHSGLPAGTDIAELARMLTSGCANEVAQRTAAALLEQIAARRSSPYLHGLPKFVAMGDAGSQLNPERVKRLAAVASDGTTLGEQFGICHAMLGPYARIEAADDAKHLRPGDIEPHDDLAYTLSVVRSAYGWTVDCEGRLCGLVAGDMGYTSTNIVIDLDELRDALWLRPADRVDLVPETLVAETVRKLLSDGMPSADELVEGIVSALRA